MTKLTEREVRAALAAEREYRMKVEAERDALREQIVKLRELVEQHAKEQHMGSVWLEAQVNAICK